MARGVFYSIEEDSTLKTLKNHILPSFQQNHRKVECNKL